MILVRSPLRVSFAGGGSDIDYFYQKFGGCVLSTSIDKYIYLSMHPLILDGNYFLKYSQTEHANKLEDIKHNYIRETFKQYNISHVDFNSSSDIPAGTGLSSSAAFACAITQLCSAYNEKYMTKEQIAENAYYLEHDVMWVPCGKQDQYASAFGGLNFIEFHQNDTVSVHPLFMPKDGLKRLERNLLMFYTGIKHDSRELLKEQKKAVSISPDKEKNLVNMCQLTITLKEELQKNNINVMGVILHENWMKKKELNKNITTPEIDVIYEAGLNAGATGGKLLGSGGGGFMLFYVEEQYHSAIRMAFGDKLPELRFKFDLHGTQIIFNQ